MPTQRYTNLARCILCALIFASPFVQAQSQNDDAAAAERKFYDVEVIIFKNKSVPKGKEYNLPTPAAEHSDKTLDLFDPRQVEAVAEKGFSVLKMDEMRLLDEVKKIIRSSRYDLLAHVGWRQPGLSQSEAIPVWIHGGKVFDKGYSSIDQSEAGLGTGSKMSAAAAIPGANRPDEEKGLYELEGAITIILARYLHTQADLVLRKPATLENLLQRAADADMESAFQPEQILLNYALKERRRMRSKRLHYLDSPEFGMLVLITPYEKAVEAEAPPLALDSAKQNAEKTQKPVGKAQ